LYRPVELIEYVADGIGGPALLGRLIGGIGTAVLGMIGVAYGWIGLCYLADPNFRPDDAAGAVLILSVLGGLTALAGIGIGFWLTARAHTFWRPFRQSLALGALLGGAIALMSLLAELCATSRGL
jgi:hypothetical protein